MAISNFRFQNCNELRLERGASAELANICQQRGASKVFLITDPGVMAAGILDRALSSFEQSSLQLQTYSDVVADPPASMIENACQQAADFKAELIIGFGGGSAMDTAKLVALVCGSAQSLDEVYGVEQAKGPRLPLILVPTTAGTGSEVTAVAIVTTGETTKTGVVTPFLLPDIALLDAELTISLPPAITAATGIDAMVHAIEAYTSAHKKNPYSDMLALKALELMRAHILPAASGQASIEDREAMLFGACLAGQAFANAPVAAVHALAYPLGGHYHIPHGLSNSLVLPEVLRFNLSAAEAAYDELAPVICQRPDARAADMITEIESLIAALPLSKRLREENVPEADLPMLAKDAMLQQRLLVNNPREVSEADALAIYQASY